MKILFDTNAYIAEALLGEAATIAIETTLTASWRIYTCQTILDEIERILVERLNVQASHALLTKQRCRRRATLIAERPSKHRVPGDPNDSPILAAACDAGVDYLVTNDKLLLSLDPYESVRIISMAAFIDMLQDEGLIDSHK
ncbi:MAG: PIN domain-containing protein [Planctomycetaceae bacterium]|nr:PIN domain-containing protein [Planctomycetaceae bacterium]